jgi:putative SOS response-associated peptidase YedK
MNKEKRRYRRSRHRRYTSRTSRPRNETQICNTMLATCTILTTDANDLAREVHDRMPVILAGADALAWIDPAVEDAQALTALLRPFDAAKMTAYPVDAKVGNVRNNSPDNIRELAA